jgi:hypothetical protein
MMSFARTPRLILVSALLAAPTLSTAELWWQENLVAWSIVVFDAQQRGPEERAAILERLKLRQYGFGLRAKDIPDFDAEVIATQRHGIELVAWLIPRTLDATALKAVEVIRRHATTGPCQMQCFEPLAALYVQQVRSLSGWRLCAILLRTLSMF